MLRCADAEDAVLERNEEGLCSPKVLPTSAMARQRRAVGALAEPDGDGVEGVAEESRVGEQQNARGFFRDSIGGKKSLGIGAGVARDEWEMVVVAEV